MILVSFFSEDNIVLIYLMKSKYAVFSNFKVTKIESSAFLGTPGMPMISFTNKEIVRWSKVENAQHWQYPDRVDKRLFSSIENVHR